MSDKLSREKRSWNMSHIRSKDTSIEVKVRKFLFSKGFRYRKNDSKLPGKPDIVLPKYKTVIFVHGCYWHRHPGCKNCTMPSTNTDFWIDKFNKNVQNDILHKHCGDRADNGVNEDTAHGNGQKHRVKSENRAD